MSRPEEKYFPLENNNADPIIQQPNPNMAYNAADYSGNQNLNREIFNLFDLDGSGRLDVNDLEEIGRAMGWKRQ
jgi:hypothetical protein